MRLLLNIYISLIFNKILYQPNLSPKKQQQWVVQHTEITWHHELWTVIPIRTSHVAFTVMIVEVLQRRGYVLIWEEFTVSSQSSSGTGMTVSFIVFTCYYKQRVSKRYMKLLVLMYAVDTLKHPSNIYLPDSSIDLHSYTVRPYIKIPGIIYDLQ